MVKQTVSDDVSHYICIVITVYNENTKHWHLIETFPANNYKSEFYEKYISGLAMCTKLNKNTYPACSSKLQHQHTVKKPQQTVKSQKSRAKKKFQTLKTAG